MSDDQPPVAPLPNSTLLRLRDGDILVFKCNCITPEIIDNMRKYANEELASWLRERGIEVKCVVIEQGIEIDVERADAYIDLSYDFARDQKISAKAEEISHLFDDPINRLVSIGWSYDEANMFLHDICTRVAIWMIAKEEGTK